MGSYTIQVTFLNNEASTFFDVIAFFGSIETMIIVYDNGKKQTQFAKHNIRSVRIS